MAKETNTLDLPALTTHPGYAAALQKLNELIDKQSTLFARQEQLTATEGIDGRLEEVAEEYLRGEFDNEQKRQALSKRRDDIEINAAELRILPTAIERQRAVVNDEKRAASKAILAGLAAPYKAKIEQLARELFAAEKTNRELLNFDEKLSQGDFSRSLPVFGAPANFDGLPYGDGHPDGNRLLTWLKTLVEQGVLTGDEKLFADLRRDNPVFFEFIRAAAIDHAILTGKRKPR